MFIIFSVQSLFVTFSDEDIKYVKKYTILISLKTSHNMHVLMHDTDSNASSLK